MTSQTFDLSGIKFGDRIRKEYKDIDKLAASIERFGLIQPIVIDQDGTLVAGGRRLTAIRQLGLRDIPFDWVRLKSDLDELELREMELEENLQREDLGWKEEVCAKLEIDRIKKEKFGDQSVTRNRGDWSTSKTAEALGESVSHLTEELQLAKAIDHFPELKKCTNKTEAKKKLKEIYKKAETMILVEEAKKNKDRVTKYAECHYQIGDAIEGLVSCNPRVFQFAEVDPPYGVDFDKREGHSKDEYNEVDKKDYPDFLMKVAAELYRVLDNNAWVIWWFGFEWYFDVLLTLEGVGFKVDRVPAIWDKGEVGNTANAKFLLPRNYEPFLIARKGMPAIIQSRPLIFRHAPVPIGSKIHPTERPLPLMQDILNTFTAGPVRGIVPFLGSGVTLRALYSKGATGTGWDLSGHNRNAFLKKVMEDGKNA